jgi:hypothetical protein
MERMIRRFLLVFIAIIFFQSCDKDTENTQENENPKLEFSPSPIALDGIDAKFSKDIPYGPFPENTFDVFLPNTVEPTPMVIYIHGGGFLGGEKENPYSVMWNGSWDFPSEIRTLLRNNIAFASINYRLLAFEGDKEGVLKPLNDSKRCLQYIRSISEVLHIDKNNIVLAGSSAGGGTSEWLAFSDDMADPSNPDPVLRESTRVKGIAVKATQASYDLERYETDIFKEYDFSWTAYFQEDPDMVPRFKSFYGMDHLNEFYSDSIKAYRKKVDMLTMMSADDPEFWASNPQTPVVVPTRANILNHHSFHARTLKRWADSLNIPNVVSYGYYHDPSGETFVDFMIRKTRDN